MDQTYIKDIIGWDVKNWSKCLEFWEKYLPDGFQYEKALELGAHNGGISLWLAGKAQNVICSDIDDPSQATYNLHKKYGVDKKISYQNIDATSIPFENEFDLICFKSILGGIGRNNNIEKQKQSINEIYKALKPGGIFLFAENLKASPLHIFFRKLFIKWGSEWRYIRISEMVNLTSGFSEYKYKTIGFMGTFGRTETQRRVLSILDSYIFNFIIPKSWRYIITGIARK